jgi:hypothetical protein
MAAPALQNVCPLIITATLAPIPVAQSHELAVTLVVFVPSFKDLSGGSIEAAKEARSTRIGPTVLETHDRKTRVSYFPIGNLVDLVLVRHASLGTPKLVPDFHVHVGTLQRYIADVLPKGGTCFPGLLFAARGKCRKEEQRCDEVPMHVLSLVQMELPDEHPPLEQTLGVPYNKRMALTAQLVTRLAGGRAKGAPLLQLIPSVRRRMVSSSYTAYYLFKIFGLMLGLTGVLLLHALAFPDHTIVEGIDPSLPASEVLLILVVSNVAFVLGYFMFFRFRIIEYDDTTIRIIHGSAYSTRIRPVIPRQTGHPFHANSATDSTANRPP